MDTCIFADHFTSIDSSNMLLKAVLTDDDLSATLRLHLISEKLIESWICAVCGSSSLFVNTKFPVQIETFSKINMAINMGFPEEIGRAFLVLNSLRNDVAHNPLKSSIPDSRIQSFAAMTNNYLVASGLKTLDTRTAIIRDEDGKITETITMDSGCQNRLKLCFIFTELLSIVLRIIAQKHLSFQLPGHF
ncbi:hypothetical protein ACFERN_002163 [Salmonella enterica]|nr:hypothetical protein [Salmonella enterica]EBW8396651.1 hypothetical protein [Salmonella enterica subsp. enterica serovar Florida]EDD5835446.1 hypothetical protein [Salmonella enterica subsp. enterica serovar Enteritidis]EDR9549909.1 hypothetical protein [Salmonella enterica]EFR9853485.1 hypothetical protein [Salmonella enterica]